jgi:uncharacterized protein
MPPSLFCKPVYINDMPLNFDPTTAPEVLPVFPLEGALLLPHGELPLRIFEPRYIAMLDCVLGNHGRVMGVIQPKGLNDSDELFRMGTLGRVDSFHVTNEGHYLISLRGLLRFRIEGEEPQWRGFRRARVMYDNFIQDLAEPSMETYLDRVRLMVLLKEFFQAEGLMCNWENLQKTSDDTIITTLAMACPFDPAEKQALLEAATPKDRAQIFLTLLEMAVIEQGEQGSFNPPTTWQ